MNDPKKEPRAAVKTREAKKLDGGHYPTNGKASQAKVPTPGTAEQVATVAACLFEAGDIIEVRRLPSGRSSWCKASELVGLANSLLQENRNGQNVFFGANPRTRSGGTKAADVATARCLFADFDTCELPDARRRVDEAGLPTPTMVVRSGGGVHVWWRLDEPLTDLALWSRYQKGLAAMLDSDGKVCDAPRIMRVPGFVNLKYNPARPCEIVEADADRTYSLDEFADALTMPPCGTEATTPTPDTDGVIAEGKRNAFLASEAGKMRLSRHMTECALLAALKALNAEKCSPPLPDDEVKKIAASVAKYPPAESEVEPEVPKMEPFPVSCLPDALRDFVVEAAAALQCDPAMVALPALATCGGAIGLSRQVRPKRTWAEPAIIWAAVVSRSGTVKSPPFDAAVAPLQRIQDAAFRVFADEMTKYDAEKKIYDAELLSWRKPLKNGALRDDPPEAPDVPVCERFTVRDVTIESLGPIAQDNPRGLFVARDELSGWVRSFNQYKGGTGSDVPNWLEAHRAGTVTIDRKSSMKVIHIPRCGIGVVGTIQPGTMERALTPELIECGLGARLLMAMPPRRKKSWTDADISDTTAARYTRLIETLVSIPMGGIDGEPCPVDLPLTEAALSNWRRFYDSFADEQYEANDATAPVLAKLEGYALRFSLIFQLVENSGAATVGGDSLDRGITLTRWFANEAKRIYALWGVEDSDDETDPLVTLIRDHGGKITARELSHVSRLYQPADNAKSALQRLVDGGIGRWIDDAPGPKGGKPKRVFELVSAPGVSNTPPESAESGVLGTGYMDTPEKTKNETDLLGAARTRAGQWE